VVVPWRRFRRTLSGMGEVETDVERASRLAQVLSTTQAAFYVVSGLWPIVHLRSFEKVTGPKPEGWLVKTVGSLISVVGVTIGWAAYRRRVTPELRILAAGCAAALGIIDVVYTAKRRIKPIFLADALPEFAIAGAWAFDAWRSATRNTERPTAIDTPWPLSW